MKMWPQEHIDRVMDLWRTGKTYKYIAEHSLEMVGAKYTKSAVANRVLRSRHGAKDDPIRRETTLRIGSWTPRQLERIRELLTAGNNYATISDVLFEECGVRWTRHVIASRLERLRGKTKDQTMRCRRQSAWRPHLDRLKELVKEGKSCAQIADAFQQEFGITVTRAAVAGRILRMRVAEADETLRPGLAVGRLANGQLPPEQRKPPKPRKPEGPRIRKSVPINSKHGIVCCGYPLDIMELAMTNCRCHWPLWQDDDKHYDRQYCGNEAIRGGSYCAEHHMIAYRPDRKRHPDERALAAKAHNQFVRSWRGNGQRKAAA